MPRAQIDIAAIPKFVRASGFVPGQMSLRAWGIVGSDKRQFRIRNWPESYPLAGDVDNDLAGTEVKVHARVNYSSSRVVLAIENSSL